MTFEYFQETHRDSSRYYGTLGVSPSASLDEIIKAYRKLAFQYHPDRNPGNTDAEARFRAATTAYEVLSDAAKRNAYDSTNRNPRSPRYEAPPRSTESDDEEDELTPEERSSQRLLIEQLQTRPNREPGAAPHPLSSVETCLDWLKRASAARLSFHAIRRLSDDPLIQQPLIRLAASRIFSKDAPLAFVHTLELWRAAGIDCSSILTAPQVSSEIRRQIMTHPDRIAAETIATAYTNLGWRR